MNRSDTTTPFPGLIGAEDSLLVVIDIQENLAPHIANRDELLKNSAILIRAARLLEIPILLTEQYPKGLGRTVPEVAGHLPDATPIEKTSFGCGGVPEFRDALARTARRTLVLCGMEAHVCVLQTALAFLGDGYRVVVAADGVGSRIEENRRLALDRMARAGATVASTEMIVMEWMGDASHPRFKDLLRLVK